eukprot:13700900-Alexandrium_andersonii.AAC.1
MVEIAAPSGRAASGCALAACCGTHGPTSLLAAVTFVAVNAHAWAKHCSPFGVSCACAGGRPSCKGP